MPATEASTVQTALNGLLFLIAQAAEKASRAEAEGSATCVWDCHDEDRNIDTPDDVLLDTLKRDSEGDAKEMLRAASEQKQCSDVPKGKKSHGCDGKTPMTVVSANMATLDPKAELAAARAGLRQEQRAEELKHMFDDAGADVIALQEHRSKQLDRNVVGSWFRRSRFKQFELNCECSYPSYSVGVHDFHCTMFSVCGCPQSAFWPGGRPRRDGQFLHRAYASNASTNP